ncbi:MAG: aminotransferase class I/II-fold pyridoxal phosphate-dependent enzyme, partial [Sphingomonadales bacterium]
GPDSIIDALNRIRGAFNLSTVAQAAGIAALQDQDYIDGIRELNHAELPRVREALEGMGLEVLPSIGNFVLVKFPGGQKQAFEIFSNLKKRGIILRPVGGYGLHEFLRITIGCAHENEPMLEAMAEELGN